MKKICILLALILSLCAIPAFAAEGDAMLAHSDMDTIYFSYCFPCGDAVYMTTWDGTLYSYRVGDADLTQYDYVLQADADPDEDVVLLPFAEGGKLYALALVNRSAESYEFVGAQLESLTVDEGGGVEREKLADVEWSGLVEYYDDSSYPVRPDVVIGAGGKAYARCYDETGTYIMVAIDLSTGARESVEALQDVNAITRYKGDTLLVETYSYNTPNAAQLYVFDPANGSAELVADLTIDDYSPLQGLAYDAGTDTVYCVKAGEVRPVDLETAEVGEGVTDMPVESYGSAGAACVLDGGYYAFCYEGAVIRNLDPAQKAQTKLKINDYSWSESVSNAYYRFANAHGDISVVLSRDYSESEKLIENMMNRDDSIDIYVLGTTTATYDALYNRGYLMELDGSAKVAELAEAMYPALRARLSTDGHLVALPVYFSGSTTGFGNEAMKALGLTVDDIPDNWPDFLDFLRGFEGKLADDSPATLFYSGMSDENARYTLFMAIFEDYQRYNSVTGNTDFNTPLLRGLLEKLEAVNFTALGCPSQAELDDEANSDRYMEDNRPVLVQTGCGDVIGNFYGDVTPVLMRVDADVPAPLTLDAMVAVVNPFTKNLDAAIGFMDELAANLSDATRYNLDPTLSEPMRGKWYEQNLAETQEILDGLRQDLEAAEAADRQMIEDSIREIEDNLVYLDQYGWDISPREVEWYRAHDDALAIAPYNWLYDSSGDGEASGEAWTLITQYTDGQIDAQALLSGIDRKVQMMLQEGN